MQRAGARHPDASPSTSEAMEEHYATLNEYLQMEYKFQPRLCLPNESESGEVTTGARDGAAHVMRCLKVWYDLPTEVLIDAVSLFDRFLTKMKVRPCHVPCITVACMNIAIDQHAAHTKEARKVSVEELVSISQSACTAGDVARMSRVVVDKLALAPGTRAVTARDWLRLFAHLLQPHCPTPPEEAELLKLLEIVVCDAACANARTSELALVVLYHHLEARLVELARSAPLPDQAYQLFEVGAQLQQYCHMSDAMLVSTRSRVQHVLARYEARAAAPQRQRLVWRLSERTLKVLRPTDRLGSLLPTIEEQHYAVEATPNRNRSGSESSENEETCDWPRSPVLPVYCDH
ncbi:cyclin G [Leguminivora glycinivorella]|uniref:cyclin G n=1 Tax=Leguminivora glycinivorella TaxID=1035111 RepID=UPI00200BC35F|nr:cyclin G [Leguminivora glycinivorella]XP_048002458.1 cyclin G [Leguminivora glycinivorella]XP_048002459.1 cyclin G [Leguminivora glycinivorella]